MSYALLLLYSLLPVRNWIFVIFALGIFGCSPDMYKRDADRQIEKILSERKQQGLGYQPQTVAETTVDPVPARIAFEKIPTTPIAPPTTSPMEPARRDVPVRPHRPAAGYTRSCPAGGYGAARYGNIRRRGCRPGRHGATRSPADAEAAGPVRLSPLCRPALAAISDRDGGVVLSALNVSLERHLFEPRPFLDTAVIYDGGQGDVDYRSALTAATTAGVRQKLPYGGEIVASTLVQFVNALNDTTESGESASIALRASVPLLRAHGDDKSGTAY